MIDLGHLRLDTEQIYIYGLPTTSTKQPYIVSLQGNPRPKHPLGVATSKNLYWYCPLVINSL